jgi:hypothetical protein
VADTPTLMAKIRGALVRLGKATDGQLLVGQTDGKPLMKTVSGDATLSAAGVLTLAAGALAASVAGRAKMAAAFFNAATVDDKFAADSIGEDKLTPAELTGRVMATVADGNLVGGIPLIIRKDIADASADTDLVMTHKVRVIDFWFVNTGIAAHASDDTIQLKNGATAITDAVAKTATVNAIKRASTINPAAHEIAAAGTLRITAVKSTNVAATVYVKVIRVA